MTDRAAKRLRRVSSDSDDLDAAGDKESSYKSR
jgi:hypothetical protein